MKRGAGGVRVASITRCGTLWRWVVAALLVLGSVTDVSTQDRRWERVTRAGVQAFEQGDYDEATRQFHAARALAEAFMPDGRTCDKEQPQQRRTEGQQSPK